MTGGGRGYCGGPARQGGWGPRGVGRGGRPWGGGRGWCGGRGWGHGGGWGQGRWVDPDPSTEASSSLYAELAALRRENEELRRRLEVPGSGRPQPPVEGA
jgi:hypothetical protein